MPHRKACKRAPAEREGGLKLGTVFKSSRSSGKTYVRTKATERKTAAQRYAARKEKIKAAGTKRQRRRITYAEVKKRTGTHSFEVVDYWNYRDAVDVELLKPSKLVVPHLVLRDSEGNARFVLGYRISVGEIQIKALQRVRTREAYKKGLHGWEYDHDAENEASSRFKQELGGMHPAELLLLEFLNINRSEITGRHEIHPTGGGIPKEFEGRKVTLVVSDDEKPTYGGLIDRFCKKKSAYRHEGLWKTVFELDLEKPRVREILAL